MVEHETVGLRVAQPCRLCGCEEVTEFYSIEGIPVQSTVLLGSRKEALEFPTGDLALGLCDSCGFMQNSVFEQDLVDYSLPTEESQAFSPRFREFAAGLADRLVDEHDLVGKTVLEVGSGKGEFLAALADRGIGHGIGIDPGFMPDRGPRYPSLEFRREFFSESTSHLTGDLVLARHFMEHIPDVSRFLDLLADSTSGTEGASLFLEVPDTTRVLTEGAFWDVYYEHCSYFTPSSMRQGLEMAGMDVDHQELGFDDQYVLTWSRPGNRRRAEPTGNTGSLHDMVVAFAQQTATTIDRWADCVQEEEARGGRVAVWGASSKAVAFLMAIGAFDVSVVDINPHKQGRWLPTVGLQVREPPVLEQEPPTLVIPMNPIYEDEIRSDLHEMGVDPLVVSL